MSATLSPEDRRRALARMRSEEFDLAIIGGGINGAGVARDAASRGLKVALVEAADFASGTSSRSSKLIHGGIRYLENREFHLVFEALSERRRLFEIAPHLVHPLRFLIPLFKDGRVKPWLMRLGMTLYDALSLYDAPELSRHLRPDDVAEEYPVLRQRDLIGAFTYSDAYMDDDRLVLETLRSARAFGAEVANYVRVTGAVRSGERIAHLTCEDEAGAFALKARHFVGAAGPWTDELGLSLEPKWTKRLRPSKGVHLTFRRDRIPLADAVVMAAESRIVFAIPRHEMVIVGTTDTDYAGAPAQVRTEPADVTYLLGVIDRYFPGAGITRADIVGCYAGVRPLIQDDAESEGKTSREHSIWTEPGGITLVAGGKYTTYRRMAEQTVDQALGAFPLGDRARMGPSRTTEPLNPLVTESLLERARGTAPRWADRYGVPAEIASRVAERHGFEAPLVLELARERVAAGLSHEAAWWAAEAAFAVERTMCRHLDDFYVRRTPLVLSRSDHGLPFRDAIVAAMREPLGWDEARVSVEVARLDERLRADLAAVRD